MWFTCAVIWFNLLLPITQLCCTTPLCAVISLLSSSRMSLLVFHATASRVSFCVAIRAISEWLLFS